MHLVVSLPYLIRLLHGHTSLKLIYEDVSVGKTKLNMGDKIKIILKNDMRVRTGFSEVIIAKTGRLCEIRTRLSCRRYVGNLGLT